MFYNPPVLHELVCSGLCKFAGMFVTINQILFYKSIV